MKDVHRFAAMTDAQHEAAGHVKDSTGRWCDPGDYADAISMDW